MIRVSKKCWQLLSGVCRPQTNGKIRAADGRLTEVVVQGNVRSVHVAEFAADAFATSCPDSSDPSLSD